jgi:hypothetical protein
MRGKSGGSRDKAAWASARSSADQANSNCEAGVAALSEWVGTVSTNIVASGNSVRNRIAIVIPYSTFKLQGFALIIGESVISL